MPADFTLHNPGNSHPLPTGVEINRRNLIAVNTAMRQRYRLYRRKKGGRYYIHDDVTGKQDSLHTSDRAAALRLFHSRNEAEQQPAVNLQIARAYLAASDPQIATRTWQFVMEEMVKLKKGEFSDVVDTANACYVILLEESHPSHVKALSEVRTDIEKDLLSQERARLEKQWIERLKKKTFFRYF